MTKRYNDAKFGKTERKSFASTKKIAELPNLVEVQKNSFIEFKTDGIEDVLKKTFIRDYTGRFELTFKNHSFKDSGEFSQKQCKIREKTFAKSLWATATLAKIKEGVVEEVVEDEVFLGDFPEMTDTGTFIVNGAERVIVSQIVRSPGVYTRNSEKHEGNYYDTQLIPSRGAWLEFEEQLGTAAQGFPISLDVRVDRTKKVSATLLLRAVGYPSDEDLVEQLCVDIKDGDEYAKSVNDIILKTMQKDISNSAPINGPIDTEYNAKFEVYRKLKPGEVPTQNGVNSHIENLLFKTEKYDLSHVGRYKFNKALSIASRIEGKIAYNDIISPEGEVLVSADEEIPSYVATLVQNMAIPYVDVKNRYGDCLPYRVIGNLMVDINYYVDNATEATGINELVYYPKLKAILDETGYIKGEKANYDELVAKLIEEKAALVPMTLKKEDILASVAANLAMRRAVADGVGTADNIDHLSNRRVRAVGELLQNMFRVAMARVERAVRDKVQSMDAATVTPKNIINVKPITAAIREFFGSSQLSQFMDHPNPIAELTHKRKISALG
ncbi:MAG: DNA-directed RNA polymerase subunit beta, partial [Christensenellaceae bacterium]|nr:DNA-directed RNA polymerase subunit beta [Christensenellaceae bacterium]